MCRHRTRYTGPGEKLRTPAAVILVACATALVLRSTGAAQSHEGHQLHATPAVAKSERYTRTLEAYPLPDVSVLNQDGKRVRLAALVNGDKPVVLNFLFATCTTVCPILASGFGSFQKALGADAAKAALISVSIDPDHDTPEVMKQYLRRFDAAPGWDFVTGRHDDIVRVMKAFDAYVDNKMNHYPLTFLRAPGSEKWVRLSGLLSTAELMAEYRKLAK